MNNKDYAASGEVRAYYEGRPKRGTATDAVTAAIREAIMDSVLPPGSWIREDSIAESLSVSRTPVREAIRRLADEGLVTRTSHHGSVVAAVSIEDLLAVYVVRQALEGLGARLAANRSTPELLEALSAANGQLKKAGDLGDHEGCKSANLLFHQVLRNHTSNPYLQRFGTQLDNMIRRFQGTTYSTIGRASEGVAEHQAIIDAIAAADSDAAEEAARLHMMNARNIRLHMLID